MPRVADYSILVDNWLDIGGSISFEMPDNVDLGSRTILSFMVRHWNWQNPTNITMKLNGTKIWDWSWPEYSDNKAFFQEVVEAGILKPGKNKLSWSFSPKGPGNWDLSDAVIWWQANI